MNLDGYYINIDSATNRKIAIEKNLADVAFSDRISMKRFPGIVPSQAEAEEFKKLLPGFSAGHLGCLLSHKALLQYKIASDDNSSDLLVTEDDVLFSTKTEALLDACLRSLEDYDWDLFYTDFIVEGEAQKIDFYTRRLQHTDGSLTLFNLKNVSFTGTTCYIVNRKSLRKFQQVLEQLQPISKLIDWHIRESVNQGTLRAFAIFPFITSLNDEGDRSVIDGGIPLSHYNNFIRRHLWIDAHCCH